MKKLVVVMISAVLCGCTINNWHLYPGPERPLTEVATLSVMGPPMSAGAIVRKVNGESVPTSTGASFYLLPGTYQIQVEASADFEITAGEYRYKIAFVDATLNAQAGHTYLPVAERNGDKVRVGFVDKGLLYPQECLPVYVIHSQRTSLYSHDRKCASP